MTTQPIFASLDALHAASMTLADIKNSHPVLRNIHTLTSDDLEYLGTVSRVAGDHETQRICGLAKKGDLTARLAAAVAYNSLFLNA